MFARPLAPDPYPTEDIAFTSDGPTLVAIARNQRQRLNPDAIVELPVTNAEVAAFVQALEIATMTHQLPSLPLNTDQQRLEAAYRIVAVELSAQIKAGHGSAIRGRTERCFHEPCTPGEVGLWLKKLRAQEFVAIISHLSVPDLLSFADQLFPDFERLARASERSLSQKFRDRLSPEAHQVRETERIDEFAIIGAQLHCIIHHLEERDPLARDILSRELPYLNESYSFHPWQERERELITRGVERVIRPLLAADRVKRGDSDDV